MGRAANESPAFGVLHRVVGALVLVSALGCGGLAENRSGGEPSGMSGMSEGSGGECNPFVGNGCEMPVGCDPSSSPQCQPPTAGTRGVPARVDDCLRNPLILDCDTPVRPDPPPDTDVPPENQLVATAENVLAANCGQCHGPSELFPDGGAGGLTDIQDLNKLIENGYVVDCSAESSRIIQVMRSGSMPPPNSGLPQVHPADIDIVAQAIEWGCTGP